MLFLSIDVGIRNLAYIVAKSCDSELEIIEWSTIELCEKKDNASKVDNITIGINIKNKLEDLLNKFVFDKIIIENQIGRNAIKMKSVQNMLIMYLIMKKYDDTVITNYSAANKLKSLDLTNFRLT